MFNNQFNTATLSHQDHHSSLLYLHLLELVIAAFHCLSSTLSILLMALLHFIVLMSHNYIRNHNN